MYLRRQLGSYHQSSPLPTSAILQIPTDVFSEATPFVAFYICFQNATSTGVRLERGMLSDSVDSQLTATLEAVI